MLLFALTGCGAEPESVVVTAKSQEECLDAWTGFYVQVVREDLEQEPVTAERAVDLILKWGGDQPDCDGAVAYDGWDALVAEQVIGPKIPRIAAARAAFSSGEDPDIRGNLDALHASMVTPDEEKRIGQALSTIRPDWVEPSSYQQSMGNFAALFAELVFQIASPGTEDVFAEPMWEMSEQEWAIAKEVYGVYPTCSQEGCYDAWNRGMQWGTVLTTGFDADWDTDDFMLFGGAVWSDNIDGRHDVLDTLQGWGPRAKGAEDSQSWIAIFVDQVGAWSIGPASVNDTWIWDQHWIRERQRTVMAQPHLLEGDAAYGLWFLATKTYTDQDALATFHYIEPCVHDEAEAWRILGDYVSQGVLTERDLEDADPEVCG